jgi:hypothetical protein
VNVRFDFWFFLSIEIHARVYCTGLLYARWLLEHQGSYVLQLCPHYSFDTPLLAPDLLGAGSSQWQD